MSIPPADNLPTPPAPACGGGRTERPTFLSLLSGIGLHDLGLTRAGWQCVGQVEVNPWCRAVLAKHWPHVFRWSDIRDLPTELIRYVCGRPALVTGGFMCTDISVAGRGAGIGRATRSGVTWRGMFRVIRGLLPDWLLIENVPVLRSRGYDAVASRLERIGYALWPVVVGAWAVGAPHKRDRVWVVGRLADTHRQRRDGLDALLQPGRPLQDRVEVAWGRETRGMADAECGAGIGARWSWGSAELRREGEDGGRAEAAHRLERPGDEGVADAVGEPWFGRLPLTVGETQGRTAVGGTSAGGLAYASSARVSPRLSTSTGGHGEPDESGIADNGGSRLRWPARPGQPQYAWEAPRLVECSVGRGAARHTGGLVRVAGRDDYAIANKEALKALGNANPPHVPELIGRWMLANIRGEAPHAS